MSDSDKAGIDNLTCEFIASQIINKNCAYSCACMYLKKNYFVDAKNCPSINILTVALITSFKASSGRTSGGERETDLDKPDGMYQCT